MNPLPRKILCELIGRYGPSLADNPRRLRSLLLDLCGTHRREILLLVNAAKEQVAKDLRDSSKSLPRQLLLQNLSKRLEDHLAVTKEAALWAVESWGLALGEISVDEITQSQQGTQVGAASQPITMEPQLAPITEKVATVRFPSKWKWVVGITILSGLAVGLIYLIRNQPAPLTKEASQKTLSSLSTAPRSRGGSENNEYKVVDNDIGKQIMIMIETLGYFGMERDKYKNHDMREYINDGELIVLHGRTKEMNGNWIAKLDEVFIKGFPYSEYRSIITVMELCNQLSKESDNTNRPGAVINKIGNFLDKTTTDINSPNHRGLYKFVKWNGDSNKLLNSKLVIKIKTVKDIHSGSIRFEGIEQYTLLLIDVVGGKTDIKMYVKNFPVDQYNRMVSDKKIQRNNYPIAIVSNFDDLEGMSSYEYTSDFIKWSPVTDKEEGPAISPLSLYSNIDKLTLISDNKSYDTFKKTKSSTQPLIYKNVLSAWHSINGFKLYLLNDYTFILDNPAGDHGENGIWVLLSNNKIRLTYENKSVMFLVPTEQTGNFKNFQMIINRNGFNYKPNLDLKGFSCYTKKDVLFYMRNCDNYCCEGFISAKPMSHEKLGTYLVVLYSFLQNTLELKGKEFVDQTKANNRIERLIKQTVGNLEKANRTEFAFDYLNVRGECYPVSDEEYKAGKRPILMIKLWNP
jgi:hypothetical protein